MRLFNNPMYPLILPLAVVFIALGAPLPACANFGSSRPDETGEVRIADTFHILVQDERNALRLRNEIIAVPPTEQFSKFKEVARQSSIDPGSAPMGGDLGSVFEGVMVKDFETAIFASKAFEVTGPFRSVFGWHLSYVTNFRVKPVAEICRSALLTEYATVNASEKDGLDLGLQHIDRELFPSKILPLLGKGWNGPFMDNEHNLIYVSKNIQPLSESTREVTRHGEFIYGKLVSTKNPMGCARSFRDKWIVDCSKKLIGLASFVEYEGRAATGRRLANFQINRSKLQLQTVESDKPNILVDLACAHSTPIHKIDTVKTGPKSIYKAGAQGSQDLVAAIKAKDIRKTISLLKAGADPNSTDEEGYSVLHDAITSHLDEVTKLLVTKGANVNYDFMGSSPLALLGNSRGADDPATKGMVELLRMHGAVLSDFDLAQVELVKRVGGPGVSLENEYVAAIRKEDKELLELFVRYFYDINKPIAGGASALHIAAMEGSPETIQFLVDHGADVNSITNEGTTVLFFARDRPENQVKLIGLGATK